MKPFPESLSQLQDSPFLVESEWERFYDSVRARYAEMGNGETVLCAERDPCEAIAVVFATLLRNGGVFLADPNWKVKEWTQVDQLTGFNKVFGESPVQADESRATKFKVGRLMIASGGTSGRMRFCVHSVNTLSAAVQSLHRHHSKKPLNSLNTLPVFHVSGLMPFFRALLTGGLVQYVSWKQLEGGLFPSCPGYPCSISLVPAQLSRLLRAEGGLNFLHRMDTIYLGGAGTPSSLVQEIRTEKLPVEFVYGMTETAAMVVSGTRGDTSESGAVWGQALPGVEISLAEDGELFVRSESLYLGYFPEDVHRQEFKTGDIGRWVTDELVEVLGRKDFLINSGGEKVNPEEVETSIVSLLPGVGVAVGGRSDNRWGEVVCAVIEKELSEEEVLELTSQLAAELAPFKIPKEFIYLERIPRSALGKVNRAELQRLISQ